MKSFSESYKAAGVDITAGYQAVQLMTRHIARTKTREVLSDIGGFGGVVQPELTGIKEPVLVSGTDGVGTKLKLAFDLDKHDTVGIDCVAMCVNDVVCCGARPLFFLDYIAVGKNVPERVAAIVSGIAEGCVQSGCALVGGETAEMPGFYSPEEYDLAGFTVGLADKSRMIDGRKTEAGDLLIALTSNGAHSNGFSLIRKIIADRKLSLTDKVAGLEQPLGEALLAPTRIYVQPVLKLMTEVELKGVAHITGGGFYENIPRSIPEGLQANIRKADVRVPPLFSALQELGGIPERDMFNTFNMGVGMVITVAPQDGERALAVLSAAGETAYILGEVGAGDQGVNLW